MPPPPPIITPRVRQFEALRLIVYLLWWGAKRASKKPQNNPLPL